MDPTRIDEHPVLGPAAQRAVVTFTHAGREATAREGDTVAVALWVAGLRASRPGAAMLYCGIGHCFMCRLTVDGVRGVRACLVLVRPGLRTEPEPDPAA